MSEEETNIMEECSHRCLFCGHGWTHKWRYTSEAVAWCYLKKVAACSECLLEIREECFYGSRKEPSVPREQQSQYT